MSNTNNRSGTLVVSLDFELMWGMFDKAQDAHYDQNILGVETAVPHLLELFQKYDIHATWATVGMLMANHKEDLITLLPNTYPQYLNKEFSTYQYIENHDLAPKLHFAAPLINLITKTRGQELASHTFSHYYCLEEQSGPESGVAAFRADCDAQQKIMARFETKPKSIVFPRNQWSKKALEVISEYSIETYRGTENHFLYKARNEATQTKLIIRALRLLDHYLNLSGHHTYQINHEQIPINIPASRFLRPYSKRLALFEPLRLRRIKKSMTHAAKEGEIFHLWWHPHNFGINQKQNFRNLTKILKHYKKLEKKYGMSSKNMSELSNSLPSS